MRVYLLGERRITSKKGDDYVIYDGVTASGRVISAFVPGAAALRESDVSYADKTQIAELLEQHLPSVEIEFNEQGRVESIDID